jgi:hypothetical protein
MGDSTSDLLLSFSPCKIHERLTLIAREQRRLRALLRLQTEARDDWERLSTQRPEDGQRPRAKGGGHVS